MTPENEIPDADLRNALYAMRDPFLTCASIRSDDGTITGFRVLFANRAAEQFMPDARHPDGRAGPGQDAVPGCGAVLRRLPPRCRDRRGMGRGRHRVRGPGCRRWPSARRRQHPGCLVGRRPTWTTSCASSASTRSSRPSASCPTPGLPTEAPPTWPSARRPGSWWTTSARRQGGRGWLPDEGSRHRGQRRGRPGGSGRRDAPAEVRHPRSRSGSRLHA